MKKMKLFMMAFIGLFVFTGCTEKELKPMEVLEKTFTNTQEVNSFTMNASVDLKMNVEGAEASVPVSLEMAIQENSEKNAKMKMSLSENPIIGAVDLYLDMNEDGSGKVYMPSSLIASMLGVEEDKTYWIVEDTSSDETEAEEDVDLQEQIDKIKDADLSQFITEKDFVYVDKEGSVKHYTLTITEELLNRVMEALGEEKLEEGTLTNNLVLDVYIDTENYQLTKISMDLTSTINSILNGMSEEESLGMDLTQLSISLEIKDYNKTTVEIPSNIIDEAITAEEYANLIIQED